MNEALRAIPSVDRLLASPAFAELIDHYGRQRVKEAIREELSSVRRQVISGEDPDTSENQIASDIASQLDAGSQSSLRAVINLTGTVLHTNLGRAPLPKSALDAISRISAGGSNLEYELDAGERGERDHHVESLIQTLTGAEAATVVNNNAAAVMICLNTFAYGKGACISRGELVEIGGSFRIPEVMEKSGARLIEVGATNRTHLNDYQMVATADLGLFMKVHTSNYEIRGFTKEVSYAELAEFASTKNVPLLADLGSGTLVNLEDYGLAHEPTVQDVLNQGADLVTFSGDKLLGGPQAGIVAGRKELIEQIRKNPLKRALRVDKMTLAALTAVLQLYLKPETLTEALPALQMLSRKAPEIRKLADAVEPALAHHLDGIASVSQEDVHSQIGSGALPLDQLPSVALALKPLNDGDAALQQLSLAFRRLPVPVVGRLQDGRLLFDLRTLVDVDGFVGQLDQLQLP